jgi:hypothetical protein
MDPAKRELALQVEILVRAVWCNRIAPTPENTIYLEHCHRACERAYAATLTK